MYLGWLWLSILKTSASPSPMAITPAFSPGPWITHGASVGSVLRCTLEDLYEQCSFHIAEKMPSSVRVGSRPISSRTRAYSSGVRPCSATSSGVIFGSLGTGGFGIAEAWAVTPFSDRTFTNGRSGRPGHERSSGTGNHDHSQYGLARIRVHGFRVRGLRPRPGTTRLEAGLSSCRLREMRHQPGEEPAPVGRSDHGFHVVFRVRHQSEHV